MRNVNNQHVNYEICIYVKATNSLIANNVSHPSHITEEIQDDIAEIKPEKHTRSILCPICGMGETGIHNNYGGRACTSCRAFFRRSVQSNSYKVS